MLDLSKNDPAKISEAGFEFNVVMPDGTETEATVKVRGKNSKKSVAFERKMYTEYAARQEANVRRGKKEETLKIEELEERESQRAANRVISWKGLGKDGVEIPFSESAAFDLMLEYPFLRAQVMEESDNLQNFRFD